LYEQVVKLGSKIMARRRTAHIQRALGDWLKIRLTA